MFITNLEYFTINWKVITNAKVHRIKSVCQHFIKISNDMHYWINSVNPKRVVDKHNHQLIKSTHKNIIVDYIVYHNITCILIICGD